MVARLRDGGVRGALLLVRSEITTKRFIMYFGGTVLGLTSDLMIFSGLVGVGLSAGLSNLMSAALGVLVVYFFVTKNAFSVKARPKSFLIFVSWYAFTITSFSFVIQVATHLTLIHPIWLKLFTLPFSFGLNFTFNRVLFRSLAK